MIRITISKLRPAALGLALSAALATPAGAQPYSQSMAQCSGLMLAAAGWVTDAERSDALLAMARVWTEAGEGQARREGAQYPEFLVRNYRQEAYDDWTGRGMFSVMSEDFRDWTAYCRSFAEARGLQFDAENMQLALGASQ